MLPRLDRIDQNLIINGLVKPLAQRKPTGSVNLTTSYAYQVIDRFMGKYAGNFNSTPTWEKEDDNSKMIGDFTDNTGELHLQQRIESLISVAAANQKISLSFDYYSESCEKITVTLLTPDTEDSWGVEHVLDTKMFSIPRDVSQTIVWEDIDAGYEVSKGLCLRIVFHDPAATGEAKIHRIKRIKLNIGNKAQEWSPCSRNLIEERILCYRYFERGSLEFYMHSYNDDNIQDAFRCTKSYLAGKRTTSPVGTIIMESNTGASNLRLYPHEYDITIKADATSGIDGSIFCIYAVDAEL